MIRIYFYAIVICRRQTLSFFSQKINLCLVDYNHVQQRCARICQGCNPSNKKFYKQTLFFDVQIGKLGSYSLSPDHDALVLMVQHQILVLLHLTHLF